MGNYLVKYGPVTRVPLVVLMILLSLATLAVILMVTLTVPEAAETVVESPARAAPLRDAQTTVEKLEAAAQKRRAENPPPPHRSRLPGPPPGPTAGDLEALLLSEAEQFITPEPAFGGGLDDFKAAYAAYKRHSAQEAVPPEAPAPQPDKAAPDLKAEERQGRFAEVLGSSAVVKVSGQSVLVGRTTAPAPETAAAGTAAAGPLSGSGSPLSAYDKLRLPPERPQSGVQHPDTPYMLRAGTVASAVLLTGINTDLPGMVLAEISADVYDSLSSNHLLIPRGTKLYGQYDKAEIYGQERLMLAFNRLLFPNGSSLDIGAMPAADGDGFAGLTAHSDSHFLRVLGNSLMMAGITAGIGLSQPSQTRGEAVSPGMILAQSMGTSLGEVLTNYLERSFNVATTLTVNPGYTFILTITSDLRFEEPYHE